MCCPEVNQTHCENTTFVMETILLKFKDYFQFFEIDKKGEFSKNKDTQ